MQMTTQNLLMLYLLLMLMIFFSRPDVNDEDRDGNSLLQIWKLNFFSYLGIFGHFRQNIGPFGPFRPMRMLF